MKIVKWSDLPKEIKERMLECQEEQGNKRDSSVFKRSITSNGMMGGFTWGRTIEGSKYWYDRLIIQTIKQFTIEEAEKTFNIKIKNG